MPPTVEVRLARVPRPAAGQNPSSTSLPGHTTTTIHGCARCHVIETGNRTLSCSPMCVTFCDKMQEAHAAHVMHADPRNGPPSSPIVSKGLIEWLILVVLLCGKPQGVCGLRPEENGASTTSGTKRIVCFEWGVNRPGKTTSASKSQGHEYAVLSKFVGMVKQVESLQKSSCHELPGALVLVIVLVQQGRH